MTAYVVLKFFVFVLMPLFALLSSLIYDIFDPRRLFRGCLTNNEFIALMELMEEDPKLYYDEFKVVGAGYNVWIANGFFGFSINEESDFTPWQRHMFFKRFRRMMTNQKVKGSTDKLHTDKLHMDKISNKLFVKQLEGKLEDDQS